MARLKKLPRRGTWEAALFDTPAELAAFPFDAILMIGERRTGLLRASQPTGFDSDITALIIDACRQDGLPPGRPKTLRCPPAQLDDFRDAAEALGAKLVPDANLDLLIDAFESLVDRLLERFAAPGGSDGFDERVMPIPSVDVWKPVLKRLSDLAPWEWLDERVVFEVEHPEIGTWYALVLGAAGVASGVSLFPSLADIGLMMAGPGSPGIDEVEAVSVHLDPVDEVPQAHRVWCEEAGLVFDERAALIFELTGSEIVPIDPTLSEDIAAVVEGVISLVDAEGATLLEQAVDQHVATAQGRIRVASRFAADLDEEMTAELDDLLSPPDPFVTAAHQLFFEYTGATNRICIKAAKKDAERVAARAETVTTLTVEVDAYDVILFFLDEHGVVWDLCTIPRSEVTEVAAIEDLFGCPTALAVMKGGAKRRGYTEDDVLIVQPVVVDLDVLEDADA